MIFMGKCFAIASTNGGSISFTAQLSSIFEANWVKTLFLRPVESSEVLESAIVIAVTLMVLLHPQKILVGV